MLVPVTAEPSANGVSIEVGTHRRLTPAHVAELAASGISEADALAAGLRSEHDRAKLARLVGWKGWSAKMGGGLVIPYHDADGREIFSRVKPDNPPDRGGKPLKYLQPKGVGSRVYFPPGVRDKIAAGAARLIVTEGEKKALSASAAGFPTVGLSGVSAWCGKGSTSLAADLAAIGWKGRHVFIAFDSDAVTNANVALEEQKLAMALEREGAIVRVVRLPSGPPDSAGEPTKQGLDDFLVASGAPALERLIEAAEPAEKPDPGSLKDEAKHADPADTARAFLENCGYGDHPRLRFHQGAWWYWTAPAYRELPEADLRAKAIEFLANHFTMVKAEHANNLLEHARSQALIPAHREQPIWLPPRDEHDPPAAECVAFRNGVVHLPAVARGEVELFEPSPRFFTTAGCDFSFTAEPAPPVRWLRFLDEVLPDQQSRELLQEWTGYSLTPDTRQQKALFIVGPKRSGKGTIARVQTALLGKANVAGPTLASLAERFGLQTLLGKPLAIIHDARLSGRTDQAQVVERLLSVTGEDAQTIDRKHRDPVTVKLPTRFMVMSNELPRLNDASGALVGRLLLLETPTSFYGREDHALTDALLAELPGIFSWAVEGWARLQARGRFVQPDAGLERLQDMADLSSPVAAFLGDRCELEPEAETATSHVYSAWSSWCLAKGMKATGDNVFGRDLLAAAPAVRKVRRRGQDGLRGYVYVGLRLLSGGEWQ